MNNLAKRVLVAFLIGPIILFFFWIGGIYLAIFLSILSALLIFEFSKASKLDISLAHKIIIILISIAQIITISYFDISLLLPIYALSITILGAIELTNSIDKTLERLALSFFLFLYFGLPLALVFKIRTLSPLHGLYPVLIVWITDTFAYFSGKLFGKHKLTPTLSPNKTIEGLIGAIFGAIAIGIIFHSLNPKAFPLLLMSLLGIVIAIAVQMGDLVASKIKRQLKIKDFSTIIPGHGGFVDRFDSFVFVMPVIFFIFFYIIKA